MAGKEGETRVAAGEDIEGAESFDDGELTLEQELEREARGSDEEPTDDAETSDGEDESKPPVNRLSEEDKKEVAALLAKDHEIRDLREKIAAFEADEDVADGEDGFDYDVGDLPAGLERDYPEIREILNRIGTFHIKENKALRKMVDDLNKTVGSKFDEINADKVREQFDLSEQDEVAVVAYAAERGMQYTNVQQLRTVVQSWRDNVELEEYRAGKTRKKKAQANPATPSKSRRATDEDKVEAPGRRGFDESFKRAERITLSKLKRGEIKLD